jgi:lipoprotein-anchoring transpeptidase ErfK/SrfK
MIRYLLIFSVLFSFIYSKDLDIRKLQTTFFDEVISVNIFKKYFPTYLNIRCPNENINCHKDKISNLRTWETTKKNKNLQTELTNRKNKIKINKNYYQRLVKIVKENIKNKIFFSSQFISLIDLNRQLFIVLYYNKEENKFYIIGSDLISSGDIQREMEIQRGEDHYLKTPTGLYSVSKGWRSDGKYNIDNTTLGYGKKGRFIYYLGKYKTIRYNTFTKDGEKIYNKEKWNLISDTLNFAIHSHKSTAKMGKPYSHGCIRMTNELNYFLDNQLVLHKNFIQDEKWRLKFVKQPNQLTNKNIAGEYIIIVDKI